MKKAFLCGIFCFFLSGAVFSLDKNIFSFRITPGFSFTNGAINEYVFESACLNTDNKESQLDWDVKNIPVLHSAAEFDIVKYLHIELRNSIAIPKSSGYMQDYDWLNSVGGENGKHTEWLDEDPTELTNYSKHNNTLTKYITFSASIGGNIKLPYRITLTPMISYYYEYISLSGTDGYKKYKSNNNNTVEMSGKVISYIQEINDLLLGISFKIESVPHLFFYGDFFISPAMTYLNALDLHFMKSTAYLDRFSNIWQLQSKTLIQYKFNEQHSLGLTGSIQYIPLYKGTTYTRYIDSEGNFYSSNWGKIDPADSQGGTKRFIWSAGISYSFSL